MKTILREDTLPTRFRSKKKKYDKPVVVQIRYGREEVRDLMGAEWRDHSKHRSTEHARKYIEKSMREFSSLYEMRIKEIISGKK